MNLVVRGMCTALEYLATHLEPDKLAHFCRIRNLNHWNYPKVGAVHTYDDTGVNGTRTVDVNTPADMDVLEVEEFISEQGICYDKDFKHGWRNVMGDLTNLQKPCTTAFPKPQSEQQLHPRRKE